MSSGAAKLSHQSDIGALCRRSKVGAERVHLSPYGVPLAMTKNGPVILGQLIPQWECPMTIASDTVGDPAQRSISKLCFSVMQVTLKIESAGTISVIITILAML